MKNSVFQIRSERMFAQPLARAQESRARRIDGARLSKACATMEKKYGAKFDFCAPHESAAKIVGEQLAKKALAKGIENVVFDRGGYLYIGRVAALADGAREAGLKF